MKQLSKMELETVKFSLRKIKVMAALLQNSDLVEENLIDVKGIVNKIRLLACKANEMLETKTCDCEKCEPVCVRPAGMISVPVPPSVLPPKKKLEVRWNMKQDEVDELINRFWTEELKNKYYEMKKRGDDIAIEITIRGFKKLPTKNE